MEEKRSVGRPKKTLNDLPDNWQILMMEKARDGASALEVRVDILGISTDLYYRFIDDYPEFSDTVKDCSALCQAYWERLGRELSLGRIDGNASAWIFNMKNRFGWRDKTEFSGDAEKPIKADINLSSMSYEQAAQVYQEMLQEIERK